MSLHIPVSKKKKKSGQERLNNEMSSTDTASGPVNTLGVSQAFFVGCLLNSGTGVLSLHFIWVLRDLLALQLSGPRCSGACVSPVPLIVLTAMQQPQLK